MVRWEARGWAGDVGRARARGPPLASLPRGLVHQLARCVRGAVQAPGKGPGREGPGKAPPRDDPD